MTNLTDEELKEIGIYSDNIDLLYKRSNWDEVFMEACHALCKRSHDSNTQYACLFVKDYRIICTGINGFPQGSPDEILPNKRDENLHKYDFINHSEHNGIYNAAKLGISLDGSTLYCLGHPCNVCSRALISIGVKNWIIGDKKYQASRRDLLLRKFWTQYFNVNIKIFNS